MSSISRRDFSPQLFSWSHVNKVLMHSNLVPRVLFPGFGGGPWGRGCVHYWAARKPSYKFGFRLPVQKNGLPGEGIHEGLVPRNNVLTNGFIWFSLARTLARILFVPRLRPPWETQKALRTWRRLLRCSKRFDHRSHSISFGIVRV